MKINGRNIKRRLYGVKELTDRLSRARHFRGHGIHSPFVYAIVRQVFMKPNLTTDDRTVYDPLLGRGVPERRAIQLQNLYSHCRYGSFGIDCPCEGHDFVVLTREYPVGGLVGAAADARRCGTTLAIMNPYDGREREDTCKEIVETHLCTAVDNRGYLLIFNNRLPKQHFKL